MSCLLRDETFVNLFEISLDIVGVRGMEILEVSGEFSHVKHEDMQKYFQTPFSSSINEQKIKVSFQFNSVIMGRPLEHD
jgi:hypothetical protein